MYEQITCDLIPGGKMPLLHASQYDEGREYRINLTENKQAYALDGTELLSISVRKGDNTLFTADIANTFSGKSYVDFVSTEQMCACAGFSFGELSITKNNTRIGTINFTLLCEPSPEADFPSDSEIKNLNRRVKDEVDKVAPEVVREVAPDIVSEIATPIINEQVPAKVEEVAPEIVERLVPEAVGDNYYNKSQTDSKIAALIDDTTASASKAYSSNKTQGLVNEINGILGEIVTVQEDLIATYTGNSGNTATGDYEWGFSPLQNYDRIKINPKFVEVSGTYTLKRYTISGTSLTLISLTVCNIGEDITIDKVSTSDFFGIVSVATPKYGAISTTPFQMGYNSNNRVTYLSSFTFGGTYKVYDVNYIIDYPDTLLDESDLSISNENLIGSGEVITGKYIDNNYSIASFAGTKLVKIPLEFVEKLSIYLGVSGNNLKAAQGGGVLFVDDNGDETGHLQLYDYIYGTYSGNDYCVVEPPVGSTYVYVNLEVGSIHASSIGIVCYGTSIEITGDEVDGIKGKELKDKLSRHYIRQIFQKLGSRIESPLFGLKLSLIGDSITEENFRAKTNWSKFISKYTGCTIQNLGLSGTGFSKTSGTSGVYYDRISQIDNNADIIGIAASFNDMSSGIPLGNVTDSGTSSVFGYVNDFFDALLLAFPTTPIICYVQNPWYNYKLGVSNSDTYVNGVKTICNSKGIPFYGDLYLNGTVLKPWIADNCEVFFKSDVTQQVDNTHPNSNGHAVIASYLISKFEENAYKFLVES